MFRWWWSGPVWLWAMFILILTSYPKLKAPDVGFDAQDKLYHFLVYFIFGVLLMRGFTMSDEERLQSALVKSASWGISFALFDELHQMFIPGRSADIYDAMADISGIVVSLILFFIVYKRFYKTFQSCSFAGRPIL